MDLHLDPLDFQNFLLINPPLTEYSDYAIVNENSQGGFHGPTVTQSLPQRRLSISNGQIGQISMMVHNDLGLMDSSSSFSGINSVPNFSDDTSISFKPQYQQQQQHHRNIPRQVMSLSQMRQEQLQSNQSTQQQAPPPPLPPPPPPPPSQLQQAPQQLFSQQPALNNNNNNSIEHTTITEPLNNGIGALTPDEPAKINVDFNGIPTHQLIYENNVIFDPQDGPIPGTTAWKKQRILERNRLAASKCRMKKKNQQKKLAEEVDDLRSKREFSMKVNKLIKRKIFNYAQRVDPQLIGLSEEDVLKFILLNPEGEEDSVENQNIVKTWISLS